MAQMDLISLFFLLGIIAGVARSDLKFSEGVSGFLSIFLLLSLGLKGGYEVQNSADVQSLIAALGLGFISCLFIPKVIFVLFRKKMSIANAAALAAGYGSVSAVTFVTAQSYLSAQGVSFSGHMVAVMAFMEIPAIVVALFLVMSQQSEVTSRGALRRAVTGKSVFLLLGGFALGMVLNESTWISLKPIFSDSFKGILALFLIDLGMAAQKQFREVYQSFTRALCVGLLLPLTFGTLGLLFAHQMHLSQGDSVLMAVLIGSASYIAAPAAIRASLPHANPALYIALPLGLTFPFNIFLGIPYYFTLAQWWF
jgi:uncharacterized protein